MTKTKKIATCCNCQARVKLPRGAKGHQGHEDESRDSSCGTWGYELEDVAVVEEREAEEADAAGGRGARVSAAILYTRLSVADAASLSHESQEATARAYCSCRGLSVSERVSDDGVSGSVPFDQRPGGQRVLELAAHGVVSHVVVAKLDRFARSAIDALTWLDKLAAHGVALHCLDLGLDTSTPVGRLVYTVIAAVAELERERIRERTREGLAIRKRMGLAYGQTPFGYKRHKDQLVPIPEALELVARAAAARAGGAKWADVVALFAGVRGPNGGRMSRGSVQAVVNAALKAQKGGAA